MSASDLALLERWNSHGDAEAFKEVATRHAGMVFSTCKRILRSEAEAEDIAQECFALLTQPGRQPKKNLGAWLHAVATNRSLSKLRSEKSRKDRESRYATAQDGAVDVPLDDLFLHVDEAVAELPEKMREAIVLHFFEDQTHGAIAESLGLTRSAVTYRIQRGIERIRKNLRKRGIAVPAATLAAVMAEQMTAEAAPLALTTALGKMALAGGGQVVAGGAAAFAGGLLSVKTVLLGLLVLAGIAASVWTLTQNEATPQQAARSTNSISSSDLKAAQETAEPEAGLNQAKVIDPIPDARVRVGGISLEIVDDKTGESIPNVDVAMRLIDGREWHKISTGGTGHPRSEQRPAGQWMAILDRTPWVLVGGSPEFDGVEGSPRVLFSVAEGAGRTEVQLRVVRGATVAGRVYDESTGRGIEGICLCAWTKVPGDSRGAEFAPGTHPKTDVDGRYTIEGLTPGEYGVDFRTGRFRGDQVPVRVDQIGESIDNVDFSFDLGIQVTGRVVNGAGLAVADATVWGTARTPGDLKSDCAQSAADGSFTLKGFMLGGGFCARATKEGNISSIEGPWELTQDGLDGVVLGMAPGARISGVVVSEDGAPLAGATVMAAVLPENFGPDGTNEYGLYRGDLDSYGPVTTTASSGTYELIGLAPGAYGMQVNASGEDRSFGRTLRSVKRIVVKAGESAQNARLVIGQREEYGLAIAGRITDAAGHPKENVIVEARRAGLNARFGPERTDEVGAYRIVGLPEGEYTLILSDPEHAREHFSKVRAGNLNADIILRASVSLEGQVVDSESGEPVADFQVAWDRGNRDYRASIFPGNRSPRSGNPTAVHGKNGRFRMDGIDAGAVTVFVRAPGYDIAKTFLSSLEPDKQGGGLTIRLSPAARIDGIVVNAEGRPIPGAKIFFGSVRQDALALSGEPVATARNDGSFHLEGLPPDVKTIAASHKSYAVGAVVVSVRSPGKHRLEIVLPRGGAIEGVVTMGGELVTDPALAVGVHVRYLDTLGAGRADTGCGEEGAYSFGKLSPGTVELTATIRSSQNRASPQRSLRRCVVVESGKTTMTDFDFGEHDTALEGAVFLNGAPASSALVTTNYTGPSGDTEEFHTSTGDEGCYLLTGLPAGTHEVLVRVNGVHRTFRVQLAHGETIVQDFDL